MIDSTTKVLELEREMNVKLDLTEREKMLLEAVQFLIDRQRLVDRPRGRTRSS